MKVQALVVVAVLLGSALSAKAALVDNFDQPADFDPAVWSRDIPSPGVASITLDTANDWAHFAATGNTDMWSTRNNAPILWTTTPTGAMYAETHVMTGTSQGGSVAGLTVYQDLDGAKPNFTLGLDHWSVGNRMVKLQGLGTNNPNISTPATGGEAWLRLELYPNAGAGGVDRYIARYKLNQGDAWSNLATLDRDVDNARMGMFLKTAGGGRDSDFSYFASGATPTIEPGDVIKLDFSTAGDGDGVLTNWNSVANDATINNPIRDSDGAVVTGVSVTFTNMINGRFNNDGNAAGWGGTAGDPYYSLGADDIYYHGQAADLSVTFSGLDPNLGYNARIYSLINQSTVDRFVVTDGAATRSAQNARNFRWGSTTLEAAATVFTGLSANASNEVVITVQDVGSIYYPLNAIVLEATDPPPPRVVQNTWDFETGDLTGWNVLTSGVPGDNLVFTTSGNQPAVQPHSGSYDTSTIQGDYWIRTWEGEVLGNTDGHTGIIETDPFELGPEALFTMVVGGGNHAFSGDPDQPANDIASVNLERLVGPSDWEMIFTATGPNGNFMSPVFWDASAFEGDTVRLRIYDTHTGGWGHIDVDNIIYSTAAAPIPEPASGCLMALGLLGMVGLGRRRARKR